MCFDIGFITCGPNEAMVISGVFHSPPTIITGGRALVCPCAQIVQRIPLSTMTLIVQSPKVYTMQGVPINVTGVAQVKINSQHEEMMRAAAEQFGDMSEQEIEHGKNFLWKQLSTSLKADLHLVLLPMLLFSLVILVMYI